MKRNININMEFTAKQIAEFVHGCVEGDDNTTVNTFAKIEEGKTYLPLAVSFSETRLSFSCKHFRSS